MRRWLRAAAGVATATLVACTLQERTDRVSGAVEQRPDSATSHFISPWGDGQAPGGVRSGNVIWIWGMQGVVPGEDPPRLVAGGAEAETRQALTNISDVLATEGAQLRDVAQCSVFLADAADAAAVASAYTEFFPTPAARTALATQGLGLGARVEIECTAVVSGG